MSNSLAAVHPELIAEWSDRNLPLTPDSVTFGSNKKVWWKGACGHEYNGFHPVFLPGSKARQDKMPSRIPESAPVTFEVLPQKAPEFRLPPGLCSGYIYY